MGRRKFRLSVHRKNEERKGQQMKSEKATADSSLTLAVTILRHLVTTKVLKISIPVSAYQDGHVVSIDQLSS